MRISTKKLQDYPFYLRPFFWNQNRKYGMVLKPALLWARIPRLFATVALLFGALDSRKSAITPSLRSMITVRVSQINWCEFCVDVNSYMYAKRAGDELKLEALSEWAESDLFDEHERLVLDYVDSITFSDRQVTDTLMTRLRLYYDEDGIVELTGLIAFQNMSSKFNSALDVPSQGFCRIPSKK
ncbi:carboxymuconolactone decarboxylase family protein [Neptuniibacter sp. SY11_33]|uniref:carboxymuconolactone decarboxylase family protein n=1 Tax=unclassified Neptuniibacter TaxID=2630693 RepID=UPI0039F6E20E